MGPPSFPLPFPAISLETPAIGPRRFAARLPGISRFPLRPRSVSKPRDHKEPYTGVSKHRYLLFLGCFREFCLNFFLFFGKNIFSFSKSCLGYCARAAAIITPAAARASASPGRERTRTIASLPISFADYSMKKPPEFLPGARGRSDLRRRAPSQSRRLE